MQSPGKPRRGRSGRSVQGQDVSLAAARCWYLPRRPNRGGRDGRSSWPPAECHWGGSPADREPGEHIGRIVHATRDAPTAAARMTGAARRVFSRATLAAKAAAACPDGNGVVPGTGASCPARGIASCGRPRVARLFPTMLASALAIVRLPSPRQNAHRAHLSPVAAIPRPPQYGAGRDSPGGPAWAPRSRATPNGSRRCVARRRGRQPRSRCSCLTGLADPCSLDVHGSRLVGSRSPYILTSGKCRSRQEGCLPAEGRRRAPALLVRASLRHPRTRDRRDPGACAAVFVAAAGSAIRTGNRCRTLTSSSGGT